MSVNARRILNSIRDADHALNDPGPGGRIEPFGDLQICELVTTQAESRTLADPTQAGIRFTLRLKTDGGDCTVTVANGLNVDGNTQAVFADSGDLLELISVSHTNGYRWEVVANTGSVALSGGDRPFLFISGLESNPGGAAPNTDATAPELASRSEVQILNVNTMAFEDLNIGTNNNLDHTGLDSSTHGIELELANAVAAGRFNQSQVYYVQTGHGASVVADWSVGNGSGYWTKFLARVSAAKSLVPNARIVMFYSQGINDSIGYSVYQGGSITPTTEAAWKTATVDLHARIRAELGSDVLIVMTKFKQSVFSAYNTKIDEICSESGGLTVAIQTPSTSVEWQGDDHHWTYLGYKNLCNLFIDQVLSASQSSAPSVSPSAGLYATAQEITITGSGTIKYTTDDSTDPHIGTVYSGPFTPGSWPVTLKHRSIERNKKASDIVSTIYISGSTWNTTDASANSITLSSGDKNSRATLNLWKSIRGTISKSSGKLYVEFECALAATNFGLIFGFASSGFTASDYLGTSNYSAGVSASAQYRSTGFTAGSGTPSFAGTAPSLNDIFALAIDFTAQKIWAAKNNVWVGSGNPAAGTGETMTFNAATVGALFPAMSHYAYLSAGNSTNGIWRIQTGSAQQTYSPPSGFSAWDD